MPNLPARRWYKVSDMYMLSEAEYDVEASVLRTQYTFIRNGAIQNRHSNVDLTVPMAGTYSLVPSLHLDATVANASKRNGFSRDENPFPPRQMGFRQEVQKGCAFYGSFFHLNFHQVR